MVLKTMLRYFAGYIVGIGLFMGLIPYGLWRLASWDWAIFSVRILPWDGVRFILAALLSILGMVFVIWSNIFLLLKGRGGPTDIGGICVSPRTQALVVTGPYRHTRNPMVFGVHAVYMALAVYLNSAACLAVLILFFLLIVKSVLKGEEKRLSEDFGEAYAIYKANTPMVVPSWFKIRP